MKRFAAMATTCFLAISILTLLVSGALALEPGAAAKDFALKSDAGKEVTLSQYKGKVVVLNFWASWCPPCRMEMPEFDELDKEFKKGKDVVMLAVNMTDGQRETVKRAEKFMKGNNFGITVLYDTNHTAAMNYQIIYLPTTYVIGRDGKIVGVINGATNKAAVMELVNKALKAK